MRKIYSTLDIGSSYIKLVVGEFLGGNLHVLCALKEKTLGFRNNQITDREKLISCINKLLDNASNTLNFKITKFIVNIPCDYNDFKLTEYTLNIDNEDGKITSNDILKVLQDSSKEQVKETEELIACIPVIFRVGDNETEYPLGKKGKTLSLKSIIVTTNKKTVYDIVKLLEACDVKVVDITTTGLVNYYNYKNNEFDKKNTVIVNIGGSTTNVSIFNKGIFINNVCLDIGVNTILKDIAEKYNLRKKEAIFLLENLALASKKNADSLEEVKVNNIEQKEIVVNQVELSEIVNKVLIEMLKNIKSNINYLTKKEISYIIITGGLAELKDLVIPLKSIFGNIAKIGYINDLGARSTIYSTSIGMLRFFNDKLDIRGRDYKMLSDDEEEMLLNSNNNSLQGNNTGILGKVFNYFFDN